MKKSNFTALVLGTVGMMFFALGMCMCLLPEWGMAKPGIAAGAAGAVILLATVGVWRKMEGKAPIRPRGKLVGAVVVGVLSALLLGVGMCMTMLFGKTVLGIAVGLVGIAGLVMLAPLLKGVR